MADTQNLTAFNFFRIMTNSIKSVSILILSLLPFSLFSQNLNNLKTEKDIIPLLCHKWGMNLKIDSVVKQIPPTESISIIKFNPDGTIVISNIQPVVNGVWNYNIKTQVLTIQTKNKNEKYKILNITDKELVIKKIDKTKRLKNKRWIRLE
ncbi:MAG: hypothetical protein QM763_08520 [Agriterribacter sp.]